MQRVVFLITILVLVLSIVTCRPDPPKPILDTKRYPGKSTGYLNGQIWNAYSGVHYLHSPNDHLQIYSDSLNGEYTEIGGLLMANLSVKKGIQKFESKLEINNTFLPIAFYTIVDYDLPLADYYIDTTKSNWVNIIRLDTVENIVEGEFEFHFELGQGGVASWPDTLSFTGCSFKTAIIQPK